MLWSKIFFGSNQIGLLRPYRANYIHTIKQFESKKKKDCAYKICKAILGKIEQKNNLSPLSQQVLTGSVLTWLDQEWSDILNPDLNCPILISSTWLVLMSCPDMTCPNLTWLVLTSHYLTLPVLTWIDPSWFYLEMALDCYGLLEMAMDGCRWLLMAGDCYGWLEMDLEGSGRLWIDMDGWRWLWMDMDGLGLIYMAEDW